MRDFYKILVACAAVFGSQAVLAENTCDRYNTAYDRTYCTSKLFIESDKELNDVYKDLRKAIQPAVREKLTAVQRDWMSYRDQTCQPDEGRIRVDCNYKVNRERAEYLRDRLRECKTGACNNSMIGQQSWN